MDDLFRNRIFWLAQLIMIVALVPWQILTIKMVGNETDCPVILGLAVTQLREFGPIIVKIFGWPLLILILCGVYLVIFSTRLRDPLHVFCVATVVLTLDFHFVSPSGAEARRLFMAIPEALFLAPLPLLCLVETRHTCPWTSLLFRNGLQLPRSRPKPHSARRQSGTARWRAGWWPMGIAARMQLLSPRTSMAKGC